MGGCGSGRWHSHQAKDVTEQYVVLDIRALTRAGILTLGQMVDVPLWTDAGASLCVTLWREDAAIQGVVWSSPEQQPIAEWFLPLTWTACYFGGYRPWFVCPLCGRRAGKLYVVATDVACRTCCRLVYATQRERQVFRLQRKAKRLRRRVGHSDNLFVYPLPSKPKGMHTRTFRRMLSTTFATERRLMEAEAVYSADALRRVTSILRRNRHAQEGI